ncbi:putative target of rapamycin (TOR) kinase 1 [Diplonema papillatum]|nr:putative target of rapamycin (TOR) kinase 1 [Diplonema papillatum]
MHTLTSTIAGHPDFVKTVHVVPAAVTVHTWVDNVRYAGSRKDVLEASRKVDELAARSKVTWKDADTRTASTRYEFIGVDWDHQGRKVGISARLSKKLARDLEEVRKGAMSASGLETLGGRLLHASAIVGVYVGEFYFALKLLRRLTNALNRGEKAVDQTIRLSGSVQRLLDGWVRAVLEKRRMPVAARVPSLTVFVDASLEGWGGVLVDVATNAIEVLGSRWSRKEKGLHINELEALAFELCVSAVPDKYAGGTVTVVVDNTTVQGVARKGACLRSQTLNDAVVNGLTRLRHMNISLSVRWVKSAGNPADLPSRVPLSAISDKNMADMALAVRQFLTGDMGLVV